MNLSPEAITSIRPVEDQGYPGPYSEDVLHLAKTFRITPEQVVNAQIGAAKSRNRENGSVGDLPGDGGGHAHLVEPTNNFGHQNSF